jgi:hypothetical protein
MRSSNSPIHSRFPLLLILSSALALPLAALAQTATLTVNANVAKRTAVVDERVFGVNAVIWDSAASSDQTISLLQAAGVRMFRIPGGSLSDAYRWDINKSDSGTKPTGTNAPSINDWTWSSNVSNFYHLINGVNAQAIATVNYGSGTPEQAAAWVAYANASSALLGTGNDVTIGVDVYGIDWKTAGYWSAMRAASPLGSDDGHNFLRVSHSAPYGIKYWEVGNECYGTWEEDYQALPWDPYTYATRAVAYINKMKAVDSTIKIGVVAVTGEDSSANGYSAHGAKNPVTGVTHQGWVPVMLATMNTANKLPDFLIYHRYEQGPGAESDSGLLQMAKTWPNDVASIRGMLHDYLGASAAAGIEIDVTENNSVYSSPGKQSTSLVNGLYLADSVGNVLQTELNSLIWWDIRNGPPTLNNGTTLDGNMSASLYGWRQFGDYGILSSPNSLTGETTYYDAYPTYYVMKLLQHFARGGDTVVTTTTSTNFVSIFATKRPDGTLRLLVINKNPTATYTGAITLTGYTPPATALSFSYGIPQDTAAKNQSGSTDLAQTTVNISGASFSLPFAPYSATVLVLGESAPSVTSQATGQTVATGQSASFTVSFSGTPSPTYQWQRLAAGSDAWINLSDGDSYAGTSTATLTVSGTTAAMSGDQFRCVATNADGSATSNPATLTVRSGSADFNGDGKADLLWQNNATGERSIWLMNGTNFGSAASLGVIPTQWQIGATGDFNGDGQADIIWQNDATGERLIWLMTGTGVTSTVSLGLVPTQWSIVGAGDFNGDGKTDLVWQNSATGERLIWLMNGTSFSSSVSLGVVPTQWSIVGTGDFNADGQADLVWQNNATGERSIWLMNGTNFGSAVSLGVTPTQWRIAGAGDFNGDGQADLLWQNAATGERIVWLMNGTNFGSAVSLGVVDLAWTIGRPAAPAASTADFNGDGQSDLLWQNSATGERAIWLMSGTAYSSSVSLGVTSTDWSIAGNGDFNGDGQADIVWQNSATGERAIWLMSGSTFLSGVSLGVVPTSWVIAGVGDFNGDGQADLLWQNTATGERALWLMTGTSYLSSVSLGTVSTDWSIAGAADFNGDGQPDIIWQNTSTGDRVLWLMNGTVYAASASLGNVPVQWSIAGTGDFNGDSQRDIVWQNASTGERALWLMTGPAFQAGASLGTIPTAWSIKN